MVVADALARIDSVLEAAPMQVQAVPQHPQDASVTLQDVHFSYDGKTEVIKGVSLEIQPGADGGFCRPLRRRQDHRFPAGSTASMSHTGSHLVSFRCRMPAHCAPHKPDRISGASPVR